MHHVVFPNFGFAQFLLSSLIGAEHFQCGANIAPLISILGQRLDEIALRFKQEHKAGWDVPGCLEVLRDHVGVPTGGKLRHFVCLGLSDHGGCRRAWGSSPLLSGFCF
jgi:hypothetical protein